MAAAEKGNQILVPKLDKFYRVESLVCQTSNWILIM